MTKTTVFPVIHSNGNSAESLQTEYLEAYRMGLEFKESFYKIDFHMRNYYPLGEKLMIDASESRQEVIKQINNVQDYLLEHLKHLATEIDSEISKKKSKL